MCQTQLYRLGYSGMTHADDVRVVGIAKQGNVPNSTAPSIDIRRNITEMKMKNMWWYMWWYM